MIPLLMLAVQVCSGTACPPPTGPSLIGTCVHFTETGAMPVECPPPVGTCAKFTQTGTMAIDCPDLRIPVTMVSNQVIMLMCSPTKPLLPRARRHWYGRRGPEPKRQVCMITNGSEK